MFKVRHLVYVGAGIISASFLVRFTEAQDIWQSKIAQQQAIVKEAKRYDEKLTSLENTVMKQWAKAYDSMGHSDRVSLARRLNIQGTALVPYEDVPSISMNESLLHQIGSGSVSLGLRKVCFGRGSAGYSAGARSVNSMVAAMRSLEEQASIDFDSFTITTDRRGLTATFYDLCIYLKEQ